ncbi:unnamed protein product [Tilletia caries]|uniref:Uncharacterized protein n=1 Tax=Tilletia caries TaxID=13290 RepID=A0ABN7ILB3_9BASI|nr:unnamed protein product [Tilletia caries]
MMTIKRATKITAGRQRQNRRRQDSNPTVKRSTWTTMMLHPTNAKKTRATSTSLLHPKAQLATKSDRFIQTHQRPREIGKHQL